MNLVLETLVRLAVALIFGGGVAMGACARPNFLQAISKQASPTPAVVAAVDKIRVRSWQRYDRMALWSGILLIPVLFIYTIGRGQIMAYVPCAVAVLLIALSILKLIIDRQLKTRLQPETVWEQSVINAGERQELVILSIAILILSLVLVVWPSF